MFTSRAEHRLLLREGNADLRMTPLGREMGLVGDAHWAVFQDKRRLLDEALAGLASVMVRPDAPTRDRLAALGEPPPGKAVSLAELLRRPELSIADLTPFWPRLSSLPGEVLEEAETQAKYAGYLRRQEDLAARMGSLDSRPLPEDLDYAAVAGLTREAVEKLSRVLPATLGQAGRISGITPAALACIDIHLAKLGRKS